MLKFRIDRHISLQRDETERGNVLVSSRDSAESFTMRYRPKSKGYLTEPLRVTPYIFRRTEHARNHFQEGHDICSELFKGFSNHTDKRSSDMPKPQSFTRNLEILENFKFFSKLKYAKNIALPGRLNLVISHP